MVSPSAQVSRRSLLALGAAVVVGACGGKPDRADEASGRTSVPATSGSGTPDTQPTDTRPSDTEPETTEYAPLPEPSLDGAVEYAETTNPFTLGVASGDPTPYRVVLWTRLAPDPLTRNGGMDERSYRVEWEVALDERFEEIAFTGAARADAEHAHSVHVDLSELEPAVEFFYRFRAGTHQSPVGRTQSMPLLTMPESITVGTTTGQTYETGYFHAHRDAARSRLDLMVSLGDYAHVPADPGAPAAPRAVRRTSDPDTEGLAGRRIQYARCRTDADLQASHASCPWIVASPDRLASTIKDDPAARFAEYKAWWEHMPVRLPPPVPGEDYRTYRTSRFGSLLTVDLIDAWQFRSDTAGAHDVLGPEQEGWLAGVQSIRRTVWNAIAQGSTVSGAAAPGATTDTGWGAYPDARERLLDGIRSYGVAGTVLLSGGSDHPAAADLHRDGDGPQSPPVTTEFTTPTVTPISAVPGQSGWVRHTITPETWTAEYRTVVHVDRPRSAVSTSRRFELRPRVPGFRTLR